MKDTLKITFQENWFEKGDIISDTDCIKMKVISTPKMQYWQKIKKFFGFSYEFYYKVKKI